MLAEEKPNKERKRSNKSIAEGLGKLFNFIKIYIWQRNHQLDKSGCKPQGVPDLFRPSLTVRNWRCTSIEGDPVSFHPCIGASSSLSCYGRQLINSSEVDL